jgi:succinylglutamate desuccinylase
MHCHLGRLRPAPRGARGMTRMLRAHHFSGFGRGPRLIVLGAVHGNETAGTRGIERVLAELDSGQWCVERGSLTLVPVSNPLAYARGTRQGERNLNRRLQPTDTPRDHEDHVANRLCAWLAAHDVLLDLHSFHSAGQPFVMRGPADNRGALEPFAHEAAEGRLAAHLGPARIVQGWMSAYAQGAARRRARGLLDDADPSYGIGTTEYMRRCGGYGVTLECGQHDDPAAPLIAYRAIRQAVALLGLAELSDFTPAPPPASFEHLRLLTVIDREHENDRFVRAWTSFDAVRAGEPLAERADGTPVRAERNGYIVFPDPGARPGHEWFYLAVASHETPPR